MFDCVFDCIIGWVVDFMLDWMMGCDVDGGYSVEFIVGLWCEVDKDINWEIELWNMFY